MAKVDDLGNLCVNIQSGSTGGTQYAEGATTSPATGAVALARYLASLPALTNGQLNALLADSSGRLLVNIAALTSAADSILAVPQTSTTGTQTSVASNATSVTVLAANTSRKGAAVYNDSTQVLYLLLSTGTASSSNYTLQIAPGAYYEVPFQYTGQLTGIWASANGNARVTELT